jgi:hypothetical protein
VYDIIVSNRICGERALRGGRVMSSGGQHPEILGLLGGSSSRKRVASGGIMW